MELCQFYKLVQKITINLIINRTGIRQSLYYLMYQVV